MTDYNIPFYFAVSRAASRADRENIPAHISETFGIKGRIEFVRAESTFRLYRRAAA